MHLALHDTLTNLTNMPHSISHVLPIEPAVATLAGMLSGNKVGAVGASPSWQTMVGSVAPLEYGGGADSSGQLNRHVNSCRRSAGPLHHVHCFLDLMYETVASRLVTTTVLLLAGMAAVNALV